MNKPEYQILANYGWEGGLHGWEELEIEETWQDAERIVKEYRENSTIGIYKYKKVRIQNEQN